MAKKRVIVYYMHEAEQAAALKAMPSASVTDSFAIGEIEESDENALRKEGLVVQDQQVAAAEDFPSATKKETASAIRYEIAPELKWIPFRRRLTTTSSSCVGR